MSLRRRVTVCELRTAAGALEEDWAGLVAHVEAERSDLVVLPELGFAPWFAASADFDHAQWEAAVGRTTSGSPGCPSCRPRCWGPAR